MTNVLEFLDHMTDTRGWFAIDTTIVSVVLGIGSQILMIYLYNNTRLKHKIFDYVVFYINLCKKKLQTDDSFFVSYCLSLFAWIIAMNFIDMLPTHVISDILRLATSNPKLVFQCVPTEDLNTAISVGILYLAGVLFFTFKHSNKKALLRYYLFKPVWFLPPLSLAYHLIEYIYSCVFNVIIRLLIITMVSAMISAVICNSGYYSSGLILFIWSVMHSIGLCVAPKIIVTKIIEGVHVEKHSDN